VAGLDIVSASVAMTTVAVALVLLVAGPHLLREAPAAERDAPLLVVPRGAVVLIGCCACSCSWPKAQCSTGAP
jgi:hypothetical protein